VGEICPECGSGLLDGIHIANYECSRREDLAKLAEQDRVWKERRMVSGHGAQDGSARDPYYKALIVFIGGPIKFWWDENWMSVEHLRYLKWRDQVEETLIAEGYLVYRPHQAFKGTWNEDAQGVNDAVIYLSDIFLNLTPKGAISEGTDGEVRVANQFNVPVYDIPPPNFAADMVLLRLKAKLRGMADAKNER